MDNIDHGDLTVCACPMCICMLLVKSTSEDLDKPMQCEHCKSSLILRYDNTIELDDPDDCDDRDFFYYEYAPQPEQPK